LLEGCNYWYNLGIKSLYPQALEAIMDHKTIAVYERSILELETVPMSLIIESFLKDYESEQTKRAYRSDLKIFFQGNNINCLKDLVFITPDELLAMSNTYLEKAKVSNENNIGLILNPKTINRKAFSLSSFFKFLNKAYRYPFNPINHFTSLEVKNKSTTQSLNKSQLIKLIKIMGENKDKGLLQYRDFIIIWMFATTGLRRAELANLKWTDIDFENRVLGVFQKGGKFKVIPITDKTIEYLLKYKENTRKSEFIFTPTENNKTKELNKPMSDDSLMKIVLKYTNQIIPDVKGLTPHSFRKTFIELALDENIDPVSIMNSTGHSTFDSLRYYDTRNVLQCNAANHIANLLT
jgi:integrase